MTALAHSVIDLFTAHGGRLDLGRAAFPKVAAWTDLSTGIAPWPYPAHLDSANLTSLPDPSALAGLEALAARTFGAAPDRVVAVPGSDLALRLLGAILPGSAGWLAPGYSGHQTMWWPERASRLERNILAVSNSPYQTIVLARPNNPDGWIAESELLEDTAQRLSVRGGQLIVDEAFIDATPGDSLSGCGWPGLIVLRSFGKFFGLAGLRLGFVIAPPDIVKRLRSMLGDWPISSPALAAGLAAYADVEWQLAQRARLIDGSRRMADLLRHAGLAILGGTAYFTLVDAPDRNALFAHLARSGLLTRPFAAQDRWLRLGVPGDGAGWTRLTSALTSWRSN